MRRALCVGIDQCTFGSLQGCANDAMRMEAVLSKNHDGSRNFECKTLVAPLGTSTGVATRAVLREQPTRFFKDPADVALFHFSGHGTVNNLDGYLVTQDATKYDDGVGMVEVLRLANEFKAREVVILLDCCFSGNLGNPAFDNSKALLREGISILTAGRGDQPSVETGGGGVFTSLVVDALDGGAADLLGAVSAPAIYAYVEAALGAWDQRPLFKSRVLVLRQCFPPIERNLLRQLPMLFPLPAEDLPLDPSYECTSDNPDPQKVVKFSDLQKLNRVRLVTPVDVQHMYDAAMQSTSTGRHYWRLAKDSRI